MAEPAILILEDGRTFEGEAYGARGTVLGEVVCNTSMTGYQELLTDPASRGQILTLTYPLVGNYGVNSEDGFSAAPQVSGLVIHEAPPLHSSWRAEQSLESYLREHHTVGISGVDQRALARHLRSSGTLRGSIAPASTSRDDLLAQLREWRPTSEAGMQPTGQRNVPTPGEELYKVLVLDLGSAERAVDLLTHRGCNLEIVPVLPSVDGFAERYSGLFLSDGPAESADAITRRADDLLLESIRTLSQRGVPIFGVGLGHLLLGRAFGASIEKLAWGHRGANLPVRSERDGTVEITIQNHGFALRCDAQGIPGADDLEITHRNLNDAAIEGIRHRDRPLYGLQYHPRPSSRAGLASDLFGDFIRRLPRR